MDTSPSAAAHPQHIASVIVGTGGAAFPIDLGEPLQSWVLDPDFDKFRALDPRAVVSASLLPQITTPVTIINGRHDTVVPLTNAEFLDERLSNSRLQIIDAGHFVWEEAPAEYASIVLDSISRAA